MVKIRSPEEWFEDLGNPVIDVWVAAAKKIMSRLPVEVKRAVEGLTVESRVVATFPTAEADRDKDDMTLIHELTFKLTDVLTESGISPYATIDKKIGRATVTWRKPSIEIEE